MSEAFHQPVALVTGANGGIGRSLVCAFKEAGYRVIATDRNDPIPGLEFDHFVKADIEKSVTDLEYATTVFAEIAQMIPRNGLNALVNNAAIQRLDTIPNLTRQHWHSTLNTNLLGPFFWIQRLLEPLENASGSVVNISSIHAQQSKSEFVAYATSKAALSALTRNMAIELGDRVRINAIEPAAVRTEMLVKGFKGAAEHLDALNAVHPIGRVAEPSEIARIAVFLCSESASFLQGSIISATGGILGRLTDPA